MVKIIALGFGSMAGGIARYWVSGVLYRLLGTAFPYGTLTVNLIGCFLIGFFASLAEEKFLMGPELRLLLMVGFCGAFTTFSTFIFETAGLVKSGENVHAFVNILISVTLGFILFKIGIFLAELI